MTDIHRTFATPSASGTVRARTDWRADDINSIEPVQRQILPIISAAEVEPLISDLDLWDMWPLQHPDGSTVVLDGHSWWFFLATPKFEDPEQRHDHARIRLLTRKSGQWQDHGDLLPDGLCPGSREWSGSAMFDPLTKSVDLYFTATGRREGGPRFEQRLFQTRGQLDAGVQCRITNWSVPTELFAADGTLYAVADDAEPVGGMIRGFRDPGYFRDPQTGAEYLFFTGSVGASSETFDGVIGAAVNTASGWSLLPPLINAVGVSKELERPHALFRDGLYYLFWSTHSVRFAPGISSPTGLYGMVADAIEGPWLPLNKTSLVAGNPAEEPMQAYCWWVTNELEVISFVNYWGLSGRTIFDDPALAREQFGGTVAPAFFLKLDGDRARTVHAERL